MVECFQSLRVSEFNSDLGHSKSCGFIFTMAKDKSSAIFMNKNGENVYPVWSCFFKSF